MYGLIELEYVQLNGRTAVMTITFKRVAWDGLRLVVSLLGMSV